MPILKTYSISIFSSVDHGDKGKNIRNDFRYIYNCNEQKDIKT